jgi:hypothetical protein
MNVVFPVRAGLMAALLLALLVAGCSTSRIVDAGYAEVAPALRERFARNDWTARSTVKSAVKEQPGRTLSITYYEWEYPDVKVLCELHAVARRDGKTRVKVFVRDHDSWLAPLLHRPSWAKGVLEALEGRLRGGGWRGMPWGGTAIRLSPPLWRGADDAGAEVLTEPELIPVR